MGMSNRSFYWRNHVQKFVLDSGMVPVSPFMLFDYYLLHTVPKTVVREAMNNLLARCDEVWVFGRISLGVKVQIGIAKRLSKPIRYFDISQLPVAVLPISAETAEEEIRDEESFSGRWATGGPGWASVWGLAGPSTRRSGH